MGGEYTEICILLLPNGDEDDMTSDLALKWSGLFLFQGGGLEGQALPSSLFPLPSSLVPIEREPE